MSRKDRCGKPVQRGYMTGYCPCLRFANHPGCHTPDLRGARFQNLRVIDQGEPYKGYITWNCIDARGFTHKNIRATQLIRGMSRGLTVPKGTGHLVKRTGYRVIFRDGKKRLEHREVMASILGRPLRADETVHHGPKGRACNDPDNLSLRLKGHHPNGHSVSELAEWLRSLGCRVFVPRKLR